MSLRDRISAIFASSRATVTNSILWIRQHFGIVLLSMATATLLVGAVGAMLAMGEADRLISAVIVNHQTHGMADIIGPTALTSTAEWADWATQPHPVMDLVRLHTCFDLAFIACYAGLIVRWFFAVHSKSNRITWRPIALAVTVVVLDLFEDVLVIIFSYGTMWPGGAYLQQTISTGKWIAVAGFAVYAVFGSALGATTVARIKDVARGLYAQRLVALIAIAVALVSLSGGGGVFEQVADAYRGWFSYPTDASGGQATYNGGYDFAAFVAFAVSGWCLALLTRARTWRYASQPPSREPRHRPWLYVAVASALCAIVLVIAFGCGAIDWTTFLFFFVVVLAVGGGSKLIGERWTSRPAAFMLADTGRSAPGALIVGDFLVLGWLALSGLGPFKALSSVVLLTWTGELSNTLFGASITSVAPTMWLFLLRAVLLVAIVRVWLLALRIPNTEARMASAGSAAAVAPLAVPVAMDPGLAIDSATLAPLPVTAMEDRPRADDETAKRLARHGMTAMVIALIIVAAFLIAPIQVSSWVGPIATLVSLAGSWTALVGGLVVILGSRKPLELFAFLRLRSAPVVTLLVIVPLVAAFVFVPPGLHAIHFESDGTSKDRATLETAYETWYTGDSCAYAIPGTDGATVKPMLIIAAEGGGIRAATWTDFVLRQLERTPDQCAASSVLLSAGASGGSIGLALFRQDGNDKQPADQTAAVIGGPEALGADISGLLAGDLIGGATGIRIPNFSPYDKTLAWRDRTRLQESVWQAQAPQLSKPYSSKPEKPTGYLILNSVDTISNCKVIISQLDLQTTASTNNDTHAPICNGRDAELANTIDLQDYLGDCMTGMTWATAAELSARFPFVSPGGRISASTLPQSCNDVYDMQLLDGGVMDNTALGTITDLSPAITELIRDTNRNAAVTGKPYVVPLVLFASNTPGNDLITAPATASPDILVPVSALLNAKAASISSAAWLTRLSPALENVCPLANATESTTNAENNDDLSEAQKASLATLTDESCRAAIAMLRGKVPQGIAYVSPSTQPSISVPLGWTLSDFTRSNLSGAAVEQGKCGTPEETTPAACLSSGAYADLGQLLSVFGLAK
jgi:hypothetical protein